MPRLVDVSRVDEKLDDVPFPCSSLISRRAKVPERDIS